MRWQQQPWGSVLRLRFLRRAHGLLAVRSAARESEEPVAERGKVGGARDELWWWGW